MNCDALTADGRSEARAWSTTNRSRRHTSRARGPSTAASGIRRSSRMRASASLGANQVRRSLQPLHTQQPTGPGGRPAPNQGRAPRCSTTHRRNTTSTGHRPRTPNSGERNALTRVSASLGSSAARAVTSKSRTSHVRYTSELVSARYGMPAASSASSRCGSDVRAGTRIAMSSSWTSRQRIQYLLLEQGLSGDHGMLAGRG